jgi:hypothetical protein
MKKLFKILIAIIGIVIIDEILSHMGDGHEVKEPYGYDDLECIPPRNVVVSPGVDYPEFDPDEEDIII